MSKSIHRLRVRAIVVAGIAASAVLLTSIPASATIVTSGYDTSTSTGSIGKNAAPGGNVTRAQTMARAADWVKAKVPYSESEGWKDSGTGGPYRIDCSGFVSMAWQLKDSHVTQTLPQVANTIKWADLQPGDALDYEAEHVILFAAWIDKSKGTFSYYAENNPSVKTGKYTDGNEHASYLDGWPTGDYTPLRYKHITS